MILDFTDCKTIEEVNEKWLEYAKLIEPYKTFLKNLDKKPCPIINGRKVHHCKEFEEMGI